MSSITVADVMLIAIFVLLLLAAVSDNINL
jgi:hypothetical protein